MNSPTTHPTDSQASSNGSPASPPSTSERGTTARRAENPGVVRSKAYYFVAAAVILALSAGGLAYFLKTAVFREPYTGPTFTVKKELPADRFNKFVATTDDLPRTYLRKPFDLDQEMTGALAVSESLAPAGKPAKIMLWSGDTTPFAEAIHRLRQRCGL